MDTSNANLSTAFRLHSASPASKFQWWNLISDELHILARRSFHLSEASGFISSKIDELTLLAEARKLNEDGKRVYSEMLVALEGSEDSGEMMTRRSVGKKLEDLLQYDQYCHTTVAKLEWEIHQHVNRQSERLDETGFDGQADEEDLPTGSLQNAEPTRGRHGKPELNGSPEKVNPQKVRPKKAGPRKVSPQKIGPQKAGPQKAGPQKVGLQKVTPQKMEPTRGRHQKPEQKSNPPKVNPQKGSPQKGRQQKGSPQKVEWIKDRSSKPDAKDNPQKLKQVRERNRRVNMEGSPEEPES